MKNQNKRRVNRLGMALLMLLFAAPWFTGYRQTLENSVPTGAQFPVEDTHDVGVWNAQKAPVKRVALTFDDGPGAHTDSLLDELAKRGVKCTFFVLGDQVDKRPETVARMRREGHEVGSHSKSHPNLTKLGRQDVSFQIDYTNNSIAKACGDDRGADILRPPYGSHSGMVRDVCTGKGLPIILWSVDPRDWQNRNKEQTLRGMLPSGVEGVRDGDIILLHDIYPTSVEAAVEFVDLLQAENIAFVTVSDLLENPQPGRVYTCGPAGQ